MPLLRRKPFVVNPPPGTLNDNSEVFVCQPTGEIFTDYSEFSSRIIQCNSLVWACSVTGRGEMTYLEALECERQNQQLLDQFPKQLRVPVVYLAFMAQKTSLNLLVDDVFMFMKERYFVGEKVEFHEDQTWSYGFIHSVHQPGADNIASCSGKSRDKFSPAAASYEYDIKRDNSTNVITAQKVKAGNIRRSCQVFTKELIRIFLRKSAKVAPTGVWVIKPSVLRKYGIEHMQFDSIFVGKPPVFPSSPRKSPKSASKTNSSPKDASKVFPQSVKSGMSPKPSTSGLVKTASKKGKTEVKKSRQEKIDKYLEPSKESGSKKKPGPVASPKKTQTEGALSQKHLAKKVKDKYIDTGRKRSFLKKQKLHASSVKLREEQKILEKRKRQEAMLLARAKKREEKLRLDQFIREWKRQRDDLECEDLKALPTPVPVVVRIPNEFFGDVVMVLEFLHSFSNFLKVKKVFPGGLTFDLLERALLDSEVAGPLVDIISMFLKALFALQEKEDDQIDDIEDLSVDVDIDGNMSDEAEAVRLATAAAGWCKLNHGIDLNSMTLNSLTVSEVLRLHLLASGGRAGENSAKWRYQQRGGYRTTDDPGLQMRIRQPHILRKLTYISVCELSFEEKLAIISCLMNQVLTYTSVRSEIEERAEQLRVIKAEVRSLQVAEVKRLKEAQAKRIKEKKEAKLKLLKGESQSNEPRESEVAEAVEIAESEKQKLERELNRRKVEVQKKASKMLTISMSHQLQPLGCDRAHRRYWLLQSVPGLFVEYDPKSAGPCLSKPTPYNPLARGDTLTYVRRLFEEEHSAGSDKENDGSDVDLSRPLASQNKKKLAEKNESVETESCPPWSGGKSTCADDKLASELWGCTASDDCRVHCGEKIQWSFFSKEEDVADLIECLNPRGIRESELRNVLVAELERINANVKECPLYKLNKDSSPENSESPVRKSSRLAQSYTFESVNLNFPVGTPVPSILEQVLRDFILDLEKKIYSGSLGSLRVVDVAAWREALANGSYKQLCDDLKWGRPSGDRDNSSEQGSCKSESETGELQGEDEESPISQESSVNDSEEDKQHKSIPIERKPSGTNYMLSVDSAPVTPQPENPTVKNLACALLQVEQSLDLRYLKKPLGGDKPKCSLLYRWEVSLMSSTSLSQLYLHANSLDMSINWAKSALNAQCCLCRRKGDAEKMLLCDNCNRGHHMYCLKPKLIKIPRGDWFCSSCLEAGPKRVSPTKKRLRCDSPEETESPTRKSLRLSAISPLLQCEECGLGGMLMRCSSCPLQYHSACLSPQSKKMSSEAWSCPECKNADAAEDGPSGAAHQLDVPSVRQRRGCTTATIAKIARFAKRLRSHSWDEEEAGSDSPGPSRRSSRRGSASPEMGFDSLLLQKLLREMMTHRDSWPFLSPVRKSQAPDYHTIIKRPMDLSTIKKKLNSLAYENNYEFTADILLVFENCEMYNQAKTDEYQAGSRLLQYFKDRCMALGLDLNPKRSKKTYKRPKF